MPIIVDPYYHHGVDWVFVDADGDDKYDTGETVLFGGVIPNGTAGNPWFDIDPTPIDSSDDPIIWATAPDQTEFTCNFDTRQVWSTEDSYVHIRMLAKDTCDNETAQDPLFAEEIVIILDDATSPVAFLQYIRPLAIPLCRYICGPEIEAFKGDVTLYGTVMDPTHWDLSRVVAVDVEIRPVGGTWEVLGRDEAPFLKASDLPHLGGEPPLRSAWSLLRRIT